MDVHRDTRCAMLLAALVLLGILLGGCGADGSIRNPSQRADPEALRHNVNMFHRDLRWARYEHAVLMVQSSQRPEFLGRYEEHGEDFHIVDLHVKSITIEEAVATVEVEQKWYVEPNMTVRTERFVERWEPGEHGWQMASRMEKDRWLEKLREDEEDKKKKKQAPEATDSTDVSHGQGQLRR